MVPKMSLPCFTQQELRKLTEEAAGRNLHSWKYTPFKPRKRPRAEEQDEGDAEMMS